MRENENGGVLLAKSSEDMLSDHLFGDVREDSTPQSSAEGDDPKFGSKLRFRAESVWARLDISMG